MEAFEFFIPQNIMVGAGTMAKLPECAKKLGGSHAMLISGPTLRKMGIVEYLYGCRGQLVRDDC